MLTTPSTAVADGAATDRREAEPQGARVSFDPESVLLDYRVAYRSRQASLLGRREVLTGKAKFGIFGDGKEVAQVALARAVRPGDFRAGYYRDQTLMMALGLVDVTQLFAQLYADPDPEREPSSAGRQMTAHFATHTVGPDGRWLDLTARPNSSADLSPTGAQMPRLVGLAWASKLYRELPALHDRTGFSRHGDEIAWGTIGNASCAEGMFWESINALGVLQAPAVVSIWDDGYGISVPNELQVTKGDLSAILAGFRREQGESRGFELVTVRGWDYPALRETYERLASFVRQAHVPAIVHVVEVTQPQGHSTSGSHERYKTPERLSWEREADCLVRMRSWIVDQGLATAALLDELEREEREVVSAAKAAAWRAFREPIEAEARELVTLAEESGRAAGRSDEVAAVLGGLRRIPVPQRRDLAAAAHELLVALRDRPAEHRESLIAWQRAQHRTNRARYSDHLHAEGAGSALGVAPVAAVYAPDAPTVNGFEVLNAYFDAALRHHPELVAFGEDVGRLGDVNQGFAGLQEKHGVLRVGDTGIREATILGQAIGLALRGLRPIAEIQYLDYILYALQLISDDLASLRYRTAGRQKAPVIVRTRGHRLEGIWHSGSPMAGILGLVRGVWVCVPRNMTQAAGFYNTLLAADDPGIVVEVLNGYRGKERLPANVADLRVPLGVPEILRPGRDVTVVTYGACCRIALEAADLLAGVGIEAEVIDVQTLLPFDRHGAVADSVRRTSRVLFLDEDVPGGASAFMLQQVIEKQGAFAWLDAPPRTLAAQPHRPAYGSDGDYWSKPNRESVFTAVYELMHESAPGRFPIFYR